VWRYPVIQQGNADFRANFTDSTNKSDKSELTGEYFITYTLCDEASEHYCDSNSSAQYDDYEPIHEEGNLFSYPNSISFGMSKAQRELSSPKYFDLTTDTAQSLSFTNAGSSTEAAVTGDIHADVNVGVPRRGLECKTLRQIFTRGSKRCNLDKSGHQREHRQAVLHYFRCTVHYRLSGLCE